MRARILVAWLLLAGACSGEAGKIDLIKQLDAVTEAGGAETSGEVIFVTDFGAKEVHTKDVPVSPDPDVPVLGCDPGEGCFMDQCSDPSDCQSGWCVEHMGEKVCSETCLDECPEGWTCTQVAGTAPDVVFICISDFSTLCRPCAEADDCAGAGGSEKACVSYGAQGAFCGGACDDAPGTDEECPWGFSCTDVTTVDGVELKQCVNDAGVCPCTETSVELGLWTPCEVANSFGECAGKRVCLAEGLSDCDAAIPGPEICNGADDDCDGEEDEPDLVEGEYLELCDDDNDCTDDSCVGEEGCVNELLETGSCDDGNPCTVADHCDGGSCVGDPVICEDENPCTDNVCTEAGGCEYPPLAGDCDDGDACTLGDHCLEGDCVGAPVDCDCLTDNDCSLLEDGNLCNGTLYCELGTIPFKCAVDPATVVECPAPEGVDAFCLQNLCAPETGECSVESANEGMACDNGDVCTFWDKYTEGVCTVGTGINCNDGNPCTNDSCDPEVSCVHSDNTNNCSDGNACTIGDVCQQGMCVAGDEPMLCDDQNLCTDDLCDPISGCFFNANTLPCDDGNACTTGDLCADGWCLAGGAMNCSDGNVCTKDSCEPETGCAHQPASVLCSDGNLCTVGDHCEAGVCVSGVPQNCDDDNPCTDDSCGGDGVCVHTDSDALCDDGDACTLGDHCAAGACQYDAVAACDDGNQCTDDVCDQVLGCVITTNENPCNDGSFCTIDDHCHLGGCIGGGQLVCDDNNSCTDDACAPGVGCQFTPNDGDCPDGVCVDGACVPSCPGGCDDGNPCTGDLCAGAEGCVFYINEEPCDDEDPCTTVDVCDAGACVGSGQLTCDDGELCTTDVCVAGDGCLFQDNTLPCDDGEVCTSGDQCDGGECKAGPPLECDDDDQCTEDACQPGQGCVYTPIEPCEPVLLVPDEYDTIQAGIDAAAPGETVVVLPGTYTGTGNKDLNWNGKAVTVRSKEGPGVTTIDCENSGRAAYFHNGEGAGSVLEGFTITRGSTTDGAGVYCDGTSPILRNLHFVDNAAGAYGGAIYAHQNAGPLIQDCVVKANTAGNGGGGMFYKLWSNPVIERTAFFDNVSQGKGGGVCAWDSGGVFRNVILGNNTGNGMGGAFFHNCTTQWTNCTVSANSGGGLEANGKSHVVLNSVFWANNPEFVFSGGQVSATYSLIQGGYNGEGNQSADPKFVNPGADDFHLQQGSPCVDQGTADGAPSDDIDGDDRPQGNGFDIGADESPYAGACVPKCAGKECGPDACGGSCGDCAGDLICKEGLCDNGCIATGDPEWYGMTGDEWCATQGELCVGLNFYGSTKECVGDAYTGCWGSQPMPEACCGKSVGGHVGGGNYSAIWQCEPEACGDGAPCSAFAPCKAGGQYAGFYWVAAHKGHNCEEACALIERTCTTAGSAVLTDADKLYAAFAAAGYGKGTSNALDRQWCTESIENSPAGYLFDETSLVNTGYYDATGTVCNTSCSNTWNVNDDYHHLCSCE